MRLAFEDPPDSEASTYEYLSECSLGMVIRPNVVHESQYEGHFLRSIYLTSTRRFKALQPNSTFL